MTRQVIYITELPSSADYMDRMAWSGLLTLQMARREFSCLVSTMYSQIQYDYALESPNTLPAGACEQSEIFMGENDEGIDEYAVCAEQMTVQREGDLEAL